MLVNGEVTIYHKSINELTKGVKWDRFNYKNVWFFGGKGAGLRKGYQDANDVEIRIPYDLNEDLDFRNFEIGDIIIQGLHDDDISSQSDLEGYQIYNITSMNDNSFGINKHIHIGGK